MDRRLAELESQAQHFAGLDALDSLVLSNTEEAKEHSFFVKDHTQDEIDEVEKELEQLVRCLHSDV